MADKAVDTTAAVGEEPEAKRQRLHEDNENDNAINDPLQQESESKQKTKNSKEQKPSTTSTSTPSPLLCSSKKLFIANLHPRVANVHLEKLLQPYGTLISSQVCYHKTGQPRGYGFCEFSTLQEASAAVKALHGRTLLGRSLVIQSSVPKQQANNTDSSGSTSSSIANTADHRRKLNDKIDKIRKALQNGDK